jgi:hypothetical protein
MQVEKAPQAASDAHVVWALAHVGSVSTHAMQGTSLTSPTAQSETHELKHVAVWQPQSLKSLR